MPFALKKLPDEPIIIVQLALPFHHHLDALQSTNRQIAAVAQTLDIPIYVIFDASSLSDLGFSDIQLWMMEHVYYQPGSLTDPRIHGLLVGSGEMLRIWIKKIKQRTGITIPCHQSLDEALAAARYHSSPETPIGPSLPPPAPYSR